MDDQDREVGTINWAWFGILAGIVIMAGTATYFLLPLFLPTADRNVAIIKADPEPFKIQPADKGGKTVDHQNLMVVDILKGETAREQQTETLRPGAASPEPPAIAVETPAAKAHTSSPTAGDTTVGAAGKQDDKTKSDSAVVDAAPATPKSAAKSPPTPVATPNPVPAKKPAPDAKTASGITKRVVVIEGDAPLYMIQLAAFRDQNKALEIVGILTEKHKKRLQSRQLETMRVDTGTNGVFHRVVSEPLPRDAADQLCAVLRRAGQDCFLRKYVPPKE
jgi:hypothetical protein